MKVENLPQKSFILFCTLEVNLKHQVIKYLVVFMALELQ